MPHFHPTPWSPGQSHKSTFWSLWIYLIWTFHINGILWHGWLLSFNVTFSRFVHVVIWIRTSFHFTAEWPCIVWTGHILFIHSSLDGILGCFYFLANSEELLQTFEYKIFCARASSFLLGGYLGVKCGIKVTLFNLLKSCWTVSKWLHHLTLPPAVFESSNFYTSLPTLFIIWLLDYGHSGGCGGISLDTHFLMAMILNILSRAYWPFVCLLWEMSIQILVLKLSYLSSS